MGGEGMEEKASCSTSATTAMAAPIPQHDDFSLFLHQHFLHRSDPSSSPAQTLHRDPHHNLHSSSLFLPPSSDRISAVQSSGGGGGGYHPSSGGTHAPSSSVGASENEADEYDCESEEGLEALLDEIPPNPNPQRSSSKRSRTAEVHNMSEKRRRSRINEKMKALQRLIPNSNKTDKASMLDEAIEYLKQLQLQVQMLTMRNGLALHPMCLPGLLQNIEIPQAQALFGENLQANTTSSNTIPINQEASVQHTHFGPSDQQPTSDGSRLSSMFNSGPTFGLDSSVQIQPGRPYQLNSASVEVCGEDVLRNRQSNVDERQVYLPKMGGERTGFSIPFRLSQPSNDIKIPGRDQTQG